MTYAEQPFSFIQNGLNQKFELMLTRRVKAYSSYWTTTVK